MNQNEPNEKDEATISVAAADAAIVRAMRSMWGHSAFATLGSIYDVAKRDHGFLGTLEIALAVTQRLPGVRVELRSPLEESRVFSDYSMPR